MGTKYNGAGKRLPKKEKKALHKISLHCQLGSLFLLSLPAAAQEGQ